jgi:predicted HAD superfamily phosphohydrolase YqeG
MAALAELKPRTVVLDVEPLIAYWNTSTARLDAGVADIIADLVGIPALEAIAFATNSHRRPTTLPAAGKVAVTYRAAAGKPFRLAPFRDLPAPGVLVGDQVATDGVLARRLGYHFVRYRPPNLAAPPGPHLMGIVGAVLRPLLFHPRGT